LDAVTGDFVAFAEDFSAAAPVIFSRASTGTSSQIADTRRLPALRRIQ
jgi:hypothetical protein